MVRRTISIMSFVGAKLVHFDYSTLQNIIGL